MSKAKKIALIGSGSARRMTRGSIGTERAESIALTYYPVV